MYENVRAEMARKNISMVCLSQETGIRYQTLSEKLRGNSPLTLKEAFAIKRAIGVDMSIEELFSLKVSV